MKKCPYCAELIQDEAVKCRYCQSMLTDDGMRSAAVVPVATALERESMDSGSANPARSPLPAGPPKRSASSTLGLVVLLLVIVGLLAMTGLDSMRRNRGGTGGGVNPTITANEYRALTEGMTYDQAVAIVGAQPEETARVNVPGVPETVSYQWVNGDGSNVQVQFQGGRLILKAQAGL